MNTPFTRQISINDILIILVFGCLAYNIISSLLYRIKSTPLKGPPFSWNTYFVGLRRHVNGSPDPGEVYERWAEEYGSVYRIPDAMGTSRVIVTDPKAIAHFFSKETYTYVQTQFSRTAIENMVGRGLLWAEGEMHRRQRKALSPAFSNAAIRNISSVFLDSAYLLKSQWDNIIESTGDTNSVIEVQQWMNRISLDNIGHAGFSHAFNALSNPSVQSPIQVAFDSFYTTKPSRASTLTFLFARAFPIMLKAPTNWDGVMKRLRETTREIGEGLLKRTKCDGDRVEEKSIIGLLIKAENAKTDLGMTQEGVIDQMNVLLLAGYEAASITLTWALIELSKNPIVQDRLREELLQQFPSGDPSGDQLINANVLPYLDAVVHEVLRLHPASFETTKIAAEDDILPLATPLLTPAGTFVNHLRIPKGTSVTIPLMCVNRSAALWGKESKMFKPERWLADTPGDGGDSGRWREIPGYRHLLTFADGPRMCLGKGFAMAEIKAVLSVLIRNYTFAFPGPKGADTEIEKVRGILIRPKIKGEEGVGACVSLRVGRVE